MPCDRRSILKGTCLERRKLKSQLDWKYLTLFLVLISYIACITSTKIILAFALRSLRHTFLLA